MPGHIKMNVLDQFPLCYVLTAPTGSEKRKQSAQVQLEQVGIAHSLVYGFGPESDSVAQSYSKLKNLVLSKRSLTPGEVAVYLGHRKIWDMIARSKQGCGLVFEDDFGFSDSVAVADRIRRATRHLDHFDLIKLFDFQPRAPLMTIQEGDFRIAVHTRPNSGMVGYLITAECCRKLLKRRYVFRPVDEELRYWFQLGIRIGSVEPNLVFDNGEGLDGSLLDEERERIRGRKNRLRSIYGNFLTAYVNIRSWLWSREVARSVVAKPQPGPRIDALVE